MRDSKRTQQRWSERIEAQRSSGLSVAEFCRREGIHKAGFYFWKRRMTGVPAIVHSRETKQAGFVEVKVAPANESVSLLERNAPSPAIELRLGNGRSLLVPPGFDRDHLTKVIAAVEASA